MKKFNLKLKKIKMFGAIIIFALGIFASCLAIPMLVAIFMFDNLQYQEGLISAAQIICSSSAIFLAMLFYFEIVIIREQTKQPIKKE